MVSELHHLITPTVNIRWFSQYTKSSSTILLNFQVPKNDSQDKETELVHIPVLWIFLYKAEAETVEEATASLFKGADLQL